MPATDVDPVKLAGNEAPLLHEGASPHEVH